MQGSSAVVYAMAHRIEIEVELSTCFDQRLPALIDHNPSEVRDSHNHENMPTMKTCSNIVMQWFYRGVLSTLLVQLVCSAAASTATATWGEVLTDEQRVAAFYYVW